MILSCQNLSKAFGSDDIIKNVSFQINEGDKVAIVIQWCRKIDTAKDDYRRVRV